MQRVLVATLPVLLATLSFTPNLFAQPTSERAKRILGVLGLDGGETVADIGCGSGWLSEAVARHVGPNGKVYAVDISERSLKRVAERNIGNIETVHSRKDDVTLPSASVDVAFLHDVATHVVKKARRSFYASVARALKPKTGRLVIFLFHGKGEEHLAEWQRYGFTPEKPSDLAGLSTGDLDARLKAGVRLRYERIRIY